MDEKKIREALLLLGAIAAILFFVWHGKFLVGLIPLALLIGVRLASNMKLLVYLIIFAIFSRLKVPFLAGSQPLWLLLEGLLLGSMIVHIALRKLSFKKMNAVHFSVIGLMVLLLVTAQQTGFGLYLFGLGSKGAIGGMIYIKCLLNLLLFILITRLDLGLDPRKMILVMFAGSICLFAMECSVSFLRQYWLGRWYVDITNDLSPEILRALGRGATLIMARFRSAFFVAWTLGYFLFSKRGLKFFWLLIGIISLVAMSGYRSDFMATVGFVTVCYYFISRSMVRFWQVFLSAAVVGLVILYAALPIMPPSVQRTGSMIFPGRVDALVEEGAASSVSMRTDIYKYTLSQVPKYIWKGRGLTTSLEEKLRQIHERNRDSTFYFDTHSYHLGGFNILIDGGVFFAIALAVFLARMWKKTFKTAKSMQSHETTCLFCWFFCYMFYLLFIGEVPFDRMEIWMMVATMLYLAADKSQAVTEREACSRSGAAQLTVNQRTPGGTHVV